MTQVPCILGVNLSDADLLEFLDQVTEDCTLKPILHGSSINFV